MQIRFLVLNITENQIVKAADSYFFGIKDDLLELSSLRKALNDLVGDVSSEVHTKSEGRVRSFHQIPQLL